MILVQICAFVAVEYGAKMSRIDMNSLPQNSKSHIA